MQNLTVPLIVQVLIHKVLPSLIKLVYIALNITFKITVQDQNITTNIYLQELFPYCFKTAS